MALSAGRNLGRGSVGLLALAMALAAGCATGGPRSPEKLRDAYVAALKRNDPKAAYALLSPEVQAEVPYQAFAGRWKDQAAERRAAQKAEAKLGEDQRIPVYGGTTVHEGGKVLRWARVGGKWEVVDGLPGVARTATPAQAVRALIEAVRATDLTRVRALLGEELADALEADWQARAEAMEAALDRPGAIELSSDLRRAELRYDANRVLTLEQTPEGWRITSLE